jgi:hypothetical protein
VLASELAVVLLVAWAALSVGVVITALLLRSIALLLFGTALLALYLLDGAVTLQTGALYLSPTYSELELAPDAAAQAALATAVALIFAVAVSLMLRTRGGPSRLNHAWWSMTAAPFVMWIPLAAALPTVANVTRSGTLERLLQTRQLVFSDDLLASVGLYLLPAGACLATVVAASARTRSKRWTAWALVIVYLVLSALTGSRSTLFLNAIFPILTFIMLRLNRRLSGRLAANVRGTVALLLIPALAIASVWAATSYRDAVRGDQSGANPLVSPDVVQFDATAHIIAEDFRSSTYVAAAVFFVPRSIWAGKPQSCNEAYSRAFFYERLVTTGAEMTCSLLGEAFVNAGTFAPVSAGILLGLLVSVCDRWMARRRYDLAAMLALTLLFRGVNLLRGDLLNTVVPLAFTFALFWLAGSLGRWRLVR